MFNFQDLAYVLNGTPVALLNTKNNQYLSLNTSNYSLKVNGVHPYLMNRSFKNEIKIDNKFTLVLSSMPNYQLNIQRSIITFGTQIGFIAENGMFLVATNNGELRLEPLKGDMSLSSMNLPMNSKFTIIDPINQSNFNKPLLFNDAVVLRSAFGGYLTLIVNKDINSEANECNVSSKGIVISEESVWKIIKTNVPFTPDWVFKRKYLNANINSYLYNLHESISNSKYFKSGSQSGSSVYSNDKKAQYKEKPELSSHSTITQDRLLVQDILLTMIGMEGNYIKRLISHSSFNDFKVEYQIEPYLENSTADPPLERLVELMLPLSFYYDSITHFLNINSNIETGLITKSFCLGVGKMIREYLLFVNQLDCQERNGTLNLQQLWWLVQPCLKLLENLHKLCQRCSMIKGGALINIIYSSYLHETDSQMKKIYKFLLDKSFSPYFEMLKQWVCYGFIDNEHEFQEFMINSHHDYTKDILGEYYLDLFWEMKFKLNSINIPEFLNRIAQKILFIGKSLNIIRECGKIIHCPFENEFESFNTNYSTKSKSKEEEENDNNNTNNYINNNTTIKSEMLFDKERLIQFEKLIEKIYDWSNLTLKTILFKGKSLESLIKSFKQFYLLECGDFYSYLLDLANEMLFTELKKINFEKLKTYIDNAMRITSANLDINKEQFEFDLSDMVITMEKQYLDKYTQILQSNENNIYAITAQLQKLEKEKAPVIEDLKVWESFVLESKIKWPLNLIFSKKNIIKYKLLFRHLLRLKVVERQLADTWIIQQNFKMIERETVLKKNYILRDMMLNCIKNLTYYFFNEIIEPNYIILINNLEKSNSMEDVMNNHTQFLDNCVRNCLLEDDQLFADLNSLIHCCTIFSRVMFKLYNYAIISEKEIHHTNMQGKGKTLSEYERKIMKNKEKNLAIEKVFIQGNVNIQDLVNKFQTGFEQRLKAFIKRVKIMNEK